MFMLAFAGGAIALVLFTSQWLLRRLFYRLGGSSAAASRVTAAFQQTLHVLIWIAFPLGWCWVGAHELGYATAEHYLGYLAGAAFVTAAVVFGLMMLVLWLFVEEDEP
jgi:hypothetical protein